MQRTAKILPSVINFIVKYKNEIKENIKKNTIQTILYLIIIQLLNA